MIEKNKIIFGLILAIIVVGLGSFGVYQNFNKEKGSNVNNGQNNNVNNEQNNKEEDNNQEENTNNQGEGNDKNEHDYPEVESKIENPDNISSDVLKEVLDRHRFYREGKVSISDITDEELTRIAVSRINTYDHLGCYVALADVQKEIPNLFGNVSLKTIVQRFDSNYTTGITLVDGYYKATAGGSSCEIDKTYDGIFGAHIDKVVLSEDKETIYLFDRVLYGGASFGGYSIYNNRVNQSSETLLENGETNGETKEDIEKIFQNALKKYPESVVTYKHTFKKYQGHYYWDSSEMVK